MKNQKPMNINVSIPFEAAQDLIKLLDGPVNHHCPKCPVLQECQKYKKCFVRYISNLIKSASDGRDGEAWENEFFAERRMCNG